jgi:hypothetical protein
MRRGVFDAAMKKGHGRTMGNGTFAACFSAA